MIRKITRGTSSMNDSSITIQCSITNIDKIIVILNGSPSSADKDSGLYLSSISTSNIVVKKGYSTNTSYQTKFSYQIIEFM